MGSSTAAGYFPDGTSKDSSWAYKVKSYYKDAGIIDTIYNIAASGRDCYTGMPTGYIPPAGRNAPDPLFNITKAISFNPKPNIIIINFPSNNYEWMSNEEILFCLRTMRDTANAHNIRCFVTTTQPRDLNQVFQREKLRQLKTLIENEFGVYSIDFWSSLVLDPPIVIKPEYAFGDGVHLNSTGHTVLKNIVIQKNIFFSPVAISFGGFSTSQINGRVKLSWYSEPLSVNDYFCVQRSI
ncbi:MAG: SGNH/GDSL hydrolase family protein, partial [Ferruginibacter sp.]